MKNQETIWLIVLVITVLIVASPLEIAMYKSWKAGLTDAINWDGRIK